MSEEPTVIQYTLKPGVGSTTWYGLTEAQRTGLACIVCQGTDNLAETAGYVNNIAVKIHSYHQESYQNHRTIPPKTV